ncbi:Glycosidase [Hoeflea phototrophica DFL-43]|uniref:Glycosidase n=1 Tax=Hoeflea phototrophica (strain DSM 17068 / NCIMB 14078 / DFL-43) TaxID=411684 RepID=A9CZD0_HOEPD|nr:sugar phosphorylase [Hoeflea phototrophica]EDQ34747.2 Glycosidase [Hoeflea phototrophica DFL-43]
MSALTPKKTPKRLREGLLHLLQSVYPDHDTKDLLERVLTAFWPGDEPPRPRGRPPGNTLWSEKDSYVITYGNSFINGEHKPLDLLYDFLDTRLRGVATGVHILPYFPYTSDDGFAVTDYYAVDSMLGAWEDVGRIAGQFRLMSDMVINHCSSQSVMFNAYRLGHSPYDKFFFEASPEDDLSMVVRPRAHPLLREVDTAQGPKHVWCTFSHDQVDFDFSNPEVLLEFLRILRFHVDRGVRTVRLDAVAFLWKEVGSPSIHLRQTHEVVRLLRLLADYCAQPLVLITETNVPNAENLSYFGNRNEAHVVYNFSLPPLLLHALLHGTSQHLNAWQMSMPPAQLGCTYFNFTASHDGIGMRPAEGLLSEEDIDSVIATAKRFGGLASMRTMPDGSTRTYEINIALFDALKGTVEGEDQWNIERFLCSQTIALGLEGIPGIYIHSLLGTGNDYEGVEKSGHNRAINRRRWHYPDLLAELEDSGSTHARIFQGLTSLMKLRSKQGAFHPNATQFTLQLGNQLFGFWRQSLDRSQSIFAIHNLTADEVAIPVMALNLIGGETWTDLISGDDISSMGRDIIFAPYQCRWITN